MTQKLNKFLDFFEKYNRDPKMAQFLNDVLEDLEGETKYIEHLETDNMQQQWRFDMLTENAKTIARAKRTLKHLQHFNKTGRMLVRKAAVK